MEALPTGPVGPGARLMEALPTGPVGPGARLMEALPTGPVGPGAFCIRIKFTDRRKISNKGRKVDNRRCWWLWAVWCLG
jgi:hypothetical protein